MTEKADFSRYDEIKKALNSKESLTYDDFVEMVGGVQGFLEKKTKSSRQYEWVNEDGGYLSGYFNLDKKCTMLTGRF